MIFFFLWQLAAHGQRAPRDKSNEIHGNGWHRETVFYENGNVKATGRCRVKQEFMGCLGRWPARRKTGKWKFYDVNGNVEK